MGYLLALDQGTTSSRAIVFDPDGSVVRVAQREFTQHFPRPGWVEHDATEIWETQQAVAEEVCDGFAIDALGITNQRETTVVWERATGRPIHPAIVWQDRRTADVCARLRAEGADELVRRKTGLLLDPYFSGTKVAWILDEVEGARDRADELAFGTIDSWLAWNLSGGTRHITDASNASRTMLFDIHAQHWDDELLSLLRVPRALLPEVVDSVGPYDAAWNGIPIAAMIGDQQSATAGQGCFDEGLGKNTYGTGCFLLRNTGGAVSQTENRLLRTVLWRRDGVPTYALEGSVFIGGAVVQWLRDGLGVIESSSEVEELAASVDDTGGVVLVPAFAGLGAPHWDPGARGAVFGITRGTTKAHLARAALEGIAFQVADLVDAMDGLDTLRVDGGASANDLLMQFQADLLQRPVERPKVLETTAFGAAFFAGLAVGTYADTGALARVVDRVFEPSLPASDARELRARWAEAVERAKGWEE
ncbi:MAG: glycerol kinase GlpK [Planctomycetota bacterium]